ncbi:hypothetical protein Tco_1181395 [Tanacetum coccineum]
MEAEVPQTLQYRGGQLNFAPLLDVENFTNWKQRFLFHIVGIEPQFKKIITNGPYFPMATVGVPKPEPQWPTDERKGFQDDPEDEEYTKSSQEYMDDLELEFHERALLANSKMFFKKGSSLLSGTKAINKTEWCKSN